MNYFVNLDFLQNYGNICLIKYNKGKDKEFLNMKWGEIVRKYKREWVLLEDVKVDKIFRIKGGKVLLHSTDKHGEGDVLK